MRKKRSEKQKLSKDAYKKAKSFLVFLKPYWWIYTIGFIFLVASSSVSVALPMLLGKLLGMDKSNIDINWDFGGTDTIYGILTLLAVLLPGQAIFSFFRIYLFSIVTQNTLRDLRKKAFEKLIKSPISYFDQSKVGELTSRIATDTNMVQETLSTTIAELFRQVFIVIVALFLIIRTSPSLALTMLGVIPVAAISAMLFGKFIKKLSRSAQDEAAGSNNILEEALTGIKSLKAYTNEIFEIKKYNGAVQKIRNISLKAAVWRGAFVGFILTIMFGAIVFIIWRGIELVKLGPEAGGIANEDFFQFIMLTVMLGVSIGSVPDLIGKIQNSIGATENLMNIIQNENELDEENISAPVQKMKGELSFDNVHFSYPSRKEVEVLKGISFQVKAGEQLAIVGGSGSGKSTIANLLLQFYPVANGDIQYDGKSSSEYDLIQIRKNIAFVPQEVFLLGGTIEENIQYGMESATKEDIQLAAQKANALEFIEGFPDGFNTVVGDRGIQLSGGQRQRIAIARAILRDPAILILDEATSALDSESEALVQEALEKLMKGRTSVVIAHRLSTIKNADKIIVLENGEIVETGTHQELLQSANGRYQQLATLQQN